MKLPPLAAIPFILVACSSGLPPAATSDCGAGAVLVVATDYQSTGVGTLTLDGAPPRLAFGSELGGDPALSVSAGRRFLIVRDRTGTVFELDRCGRAMASFATRRPDEPPGVDPQAAAALSDGSLVVPRFAVPSAAHVGADGSVRATIDLSSHDADGNPNMNAADTATIGGKERAVLLLERLDDAALFDAKQSAEAVVIEPTSLVVERTIDLAVRNPFGAMRKAGPSRFWIAAAGNFSRDDETDAGIVRLDVETATSTLVVAERDLGGSATEVAVDEASGCGAAIVADAGQANRTSVVTFDARSGRVGEIVVGPTGGFDLRGLAWVNEGRTLLVGDRRSIANFGFPVHVFARDATCGLVEAPPIALPLPAIAFGP